MIALWVPKAKWTRRSLLLCNSVRALRWVSSRTWDTIIIWFTSFVFLEPSRAPGSRISVNCVASDVWLELAWPWRWKHLLFAESHWIAGNWFKCFLSGRYRVISTGPWCRVWVFRVVPCLNSTRTSLTECIGNGIGSWSHRAILTHGLVNKWVRWASSLEFNIRKAMVNLRLRQRCLVLVWCRVVLNFAFCPRKKHRLAHVAASDCFVLRRVIFARPWNKIILIVKHCPGFNIPRLLCRHYNFPDPPDVDIFSPSFIYGVTHMHY